MITALWILGVLAFIAFLIWAPEFRALISHIIYSVLEALRSIT